MKLYNLLEGNEFECELTTEDFEPSHSFCWDGDSYISEEGYKKFKKILDSRAKLIKNGNIVILNKKVTEEELEEFVSSLAGYCSTSDYEKWFEKEKQ